MAQVSSSPLILLVILELGIPDRFVGIDQSVTTRQRIDIRRNPVMGIQKLEKHLDITIQKPFPRNISYALRVSDWIFVVFHQQIREIRVTMSVT